MRIKTARCSNSVGKWRLESLPESIFVHDHCGSHKCLLRGGSSGNELEGNKALSVPLRRIVLARASVPNGVCVASTEDPIAISTNPISGDDSLVGSAHVHEEAFKVRSLGPEGYIQCAGRPHTGGYNVKVVGRLTCLCWWSMER